MTSSRLPSRKVRTLLWVALALGANVVLPWLLARGTRTGEALDFIDCDEQPHLHQAS